MTQLYRVSESWDTGDAECLAENGYLWLGEVKDYGEENRGMDVFKLRSLATGRQWAWFRWQLQEVEDE